MPISPLDWQPVNSKKIFSTRIFDINEIESRSPENDPATFFSIHAADWVIVVPVIRDEKGVESFLMVKQWRHGAEQLSVEFPGGVIDKGEKPAQAAARELLEETGYRAGELTLAASISPNPAIMDNQCHIFFARNLIDTHQLDLDDDEFVNTEAIPIAQVMEEMGHGLYIHALMTSALFFYIQKNGLCGT